MLDIKTFFGNAVIKINKFIKLGQSIKRPTASSQINPSEIIPQKATIKNRFDMLMSEIALVQERVKVMSISLASLAEQIGRASSTQAIAIEKINKLTSDLQAITKLLEEKTAAAQTAVDVNELNQLIETLKSSTDNLTTAIKPNKEE